MPGMPRHLENTITGTVYAQRTFSAERESASVKQVARSACDEELVLAAQNTLADDSASLH